jgi:hypothetical protein
MIMGKKLAIGGSAIVLLGAAYLEPIEALRCE